MRKYLSGLFAFMLAAVLILCTGISVQAMTVSYSPSSTRLSKGISVMKSGSSERNKLENAINAVVNTPLSVQSESEIQNAIISSIDSAMGRCGASNCWSLSNADYKVYIYQSEYTIRPVNGSASDPSTADGTYSFSIALKWQQETDLAGIFGEKYAEYIPWITSKSRPSSAEIFTVTIKAKSYCETIGKSCLFEETTITDVPATCTDDGLGHITRTCSVCGRVENGENIVIPATGHIEDEWILASEDVRPCNETGTETWEIYCTVCGELVETEVLETYTEHDIILATCTEPETCAVCGENFSAAHGHKRNTYTVIIEADCENDGLIGFYCTECGAYVTETVPALGHIPGDDYREGSKTEMQNLYNEYAGIKLAKTAPMSFASVATDNDTYYCYHCEYCGEVEMGKVCTHNNTTETFYKVTSYNSDGTPVLGAVSTDVEKDRCSTDVTRTLVCNDCGKTVFTNILAKHDHEYAVYLGASATCAKAGDVECKQKKCIYCGNTKTLNAADRVNVSGEYNMANHDKKSMENRTSINGVSLLLVQGDCKTPSVYLAICSRCKALITEERVNEARAQYLAGKKVEVWYQYEDHTWADGETVDATCEHAGHTTQVCSVCGKTGKTMYQSVMAHSYEVDNDSAEWTLDENGMPTGVAADLCCNVCLHRVHESVSQIREVSDAYVAPTCSAPGKRTFSALVTADSDDYTFLIDVALPVDPEAHVFGEYVSDNNATCTTNCTKTAECTLCHVKDTQEIENTTLEHNKVTSYLDEIPATCSTEGSRIKVVICDMCNEEFSREPEVLDLDPDNHEGELVIEEAVAATCTASGRTEGSHYECCGKIVTEQEDIPALGHEPRDSETTNLRNGAFDGNGNFITTNCVTDGSYDIVYYCDRCGEDIRTETVQVKANGPHDYVIDYDCDRVTCTATAECRTAGCNSIITERNQIRFVIEEQATCLSDALGHYVAEFTNELFDTWTSISEYLEGTKLEHIWGDPQYSMSDNFTACTCTLKCVREYENNDNKCGVTRTVNCTVTPVTVQEPTDCATEKKVKYEIVLQSEHGFDTVLFPEGRGTGEFGAHAASGEPEIGLTRNGAFNETGEFITSDCVTDGSYELVYKCSVPGCHENNPALHTTEVQVRANGPHAGELSNNGYTVTYSGDGITSYNATKTCACGLVLDTASAVITDNEASVKPSTYSTDYTVTYTAAFDVDWAVSKVTYVNKRTPNPPFVITHDWVSYKTKGDTCKERGDLRRYCRNCGTDELVEKGEGDYGDHVYDWVTASPATCTEPEYLEYRCLNCGIFGKDEIGVSRMKGKPATKHSGTLRDIEGTDTATCTKPGTKQQQYSGCKCIITVNSPAKGHYYGTVVGTADVCRKCSNINNGVLCGEPIGHDFTRTLSSVYHEPTCTTDGYYVVECIGCSRQTQKQYESGTALGHKEYLVSSTTGSDCQHTGINTYKCNRSNCDVPGYTRSAANSKYGEHIKYTTYSHNNGNTHTATTSCRLCDWSVSETADHTITTTTDFMNDTMHRIVLSCNVCNWSVTTTEGHNKCSDITDVGDANKHRRITSCDKCKWSETVMEAHDMGGYHVVSDITAHRIVSSCTQCGYAKTVSAPHEMKTTYSSNDSGGHTKTMTCTVCGYSTSSSENHSTNTIYTNNGSSGHTALTYCTYCTWENSSIESHSLSTSYSSNGSSSHTKTTSCSRCSYSTSSTESHSLTTTYSSNGSSSHTMYKSCSKCSYNVSASESHSLSTSYSSNGSSNHTKAATCSKCSYSTSSTESHSTSTTYTSNGSSGHTKTTSCSKCNYSTSSTGSHSTSTTYANTGTTHTKTTSCSKCSYSTSGSESHSTSTSYSSTGTSNHTKTTSCSKCSYSTSSTESHSKSTTYTSEGAYTHTIKTSCSKCNYSSSNSASHSKSTIYTAANNTSHQYYEKCSTCGWQSSSKTESHNFVKETSTRSRCACGKIIENGVIKAIKPGDSVMDLGDDVFESSELIQDINTVADLIERTDTSEELDIANNIVITGSAISLETDEDTDVSALIEVSEEDSDTSENVETLEVEEVSKFEETLEAEEIPDEEIPTVEEISETEDIIMIEEETVENVTELPVAEDVITDATPVSAYTISFRVNGIEIGTWNVSEDETVTAPAIEVISLYLNEGETFIGWDSDFTEIHNNMIINAVVDTVQTSVEEDMIEETIDETVTEFIDEMPSEMIDEAITNAVQITEDTSIPEVLENETAEIVTENIAA